jgi:hypothetical protein
MLKRVYNGKVNRYRTTTTEQRRSTTMKIKPEALCAWCGKVLQAPETAWLVKAQTVGDLPEHEGKFAIKLAKSGRTITGFPATSASPAGQGEGIEVIFATCGQECTLALKAAVREEAGHLGLVIT